MVKLFGTTLRETLEILSEKRADAGSKKPTTDPYDKQKVIVRIILTFLLLLTGVFLIGLDKGNSQTVGASIISGILGYWLK